MSYSSNLYKIISQSNACACECNPYLAASQHLCINAWSYHMHVHGRIKKTLKGNPNLTYEEKTKSKQRDRDSKT